MKHGYPISRRNQRNCRWNSDTHPLRQDQSQTNAVKAQDYGNSILGPARCFAGGLYATRNNGQLRCLLRNSMEAQKSIAKRSSMLSKGVLLLHDNTRPNTSRKIRELIKSFGWEFLDHTHHTAPTLLRVNSIFPVPQTQSWREACQ
ncbi:hypothetical protein TNCV_641701 [Trichonephila clavipes]|nr:hypothetical protein TNCV_641701 [Trichonephila clavipes]